MALAKALGLAVVLTTALVVLIGQAPASATITTICVERQTHCSVENLYGVDINAKDTISGSLVSDSPGGGGKGEAIIETAKGNVACKASSYKAKLNSDGTAPKGGGIAELNFGGPFNEKTKTWENCSTTIEGCVVEKMAATSLHGTFTASVLYGEGSAEWDGELTIENPETTILLRCTGGELTRECTYSGKLVEEGVLKTHPVVGKIYNPGNPNAPTKDVYSGTTEKKAVVDIKAGFEKVSGNLSCPTTGTERMTETISGDNLAGPGPYATW